MHIHPKLIYLLLFVGLFIGCTKAEKERGEQMEEVNLPEEASTYHHYNQYDDQIKILAEQKDIDWILIKAVIIKESHFDPMYISTAGAVGLMQLMPREGSFITENYRNFQAARRQTRNRAGERIYQGKTDVEWANGYVNELDSLKRVYQDHKEDLFEKEQRFDPAKNLASGIKQLSGDYAYFRSRGHGAYGSRIYALAAYNAGRGAVVVDKTNRRLDRIPVNRQTELYVGYIERIYTELLKEDGKVTIDNEWILKI